MFSLPNQKNKKHIPYSRPEPAPTMFPVGGHDNHNEDKGSMKKNSRRWNSLLRVALFILSLLGMYISAQFSVDGFRFQVDERAWIGWGIAAILVGIESVWQKFGGNVTLFVLAVTCYAYGIVTNVVGIMANRGITSNWDYLVPIIFGILLEVFPEPVLAWAISGDTSSDPIGKLLERADEMWGDEDKPAKRKYQYEQKFLNRLPKNDQ